MRAYRSFSGTWYCVGAHTCVMVLQLASGSYPTSFFFVLSYNNSYYYFPQRVKENEKLVGYKKLEFLFVFMNGA